MKSQTHLMIVPEFPGSITGTDFQPSRGARLACEAEVR